MRGLRLVQSAAALGKRRARQAAMQFDADVPQAKLRGTSTSARKVRLVGMVSAAVAVAATKGNSGQSA
jgi:hypothetical protein